MLQEYKIELRARYDECDPMGFVHHSNYLRYFEIARTELYRANGGNYRDFELSGLFVVVVRIDCRYKSPARYDDLLEITVAIKEVSDAKILQQYVVTKGDQKLITAEVTLAVIDREGRPQRIPPSMRLD